MPTTPEVWATIYRLSHWSPVGWSARDVGQPSTHRTWTMLVPMSKAPA